jgi:hypothetical protein
VVAEALGETAKGVVPTEAKYLPSVPATEPVRVKEDTQYVLTLRCWRERLAGQMADILRGKLGVSEDDS